MFYFILLLCVICFVLFLSKEPCPQAPNPFLYQRMKGLTDKVHLVPAGSRDLSPNHFLPTAYLSHFSHFLSGCYGYLFCPRHGPFTIFATINSSLASSQQT